MKTDAKNPGRGRGAAYLEIGRYVCEALQAGRDPIPAGVPILARESEDGDLVVLVRAAMRAERRRIEAESEK